MPKICFVPGCKTESNRSCKQSRKPGEKHLALFSVPKDPVLRKQWHIASRRADREMTAKDVMCELHFTEDCIERYFTSKVYDGSIFKLERDRPRLKKGSVPTIFPFSKSDSVSKTGRPKKLFTVQNKENGSGDLDLRKKSSPSKFPSQELACSAYGCTNSSDKKVSGISFHKFPRNETRRTWISAVGRKDWQPSKESVLCSAHFTPDQIEQTGSSVRLRPGAIPTIFSLGEKQPFEDSDEDEVPLNETDYFDQGESDEIPEEMSSSYEDMPSKYSISNNIVEGHEEVFGKFVANELKILSCDPPLYLRTKQKIWQVLEDVSQMRVT